MKFIDLTMTLDNDCMTCGTPWHEKVAISPMGQLNTVGRNTSRFILGSHSGTHIDAPKHFIDGGRDITELRLDVLCGPVTIVDLSQKKKGDIVTPDDLNGTEITPRMIFRYEWYDYWKTDQYYDSFPFLTMETAVYLVKSGIKLLAMDTPSPDDGSNIVSHGKEDSPVHKFLLKHDVVIVEYLTNTRKIDSFKKNCIIALPLKVAGADGSPGRVLIVEES